MKIKVEFTLQMPELGGQTVTRDQIDAWLAYQLDTSGMLGMSNPLVEYDIGADSDSIEWSEIK